MSIYDINIKNIYGGEKTLEKYKGKLLLIVNTASKCGFTPQFEGLEKLNQKYKDKGLVVLGFPCNQFKEQDPGTDEEILNFCQMNYGVTFEMFAKLDVNGENRHPLYRYLIDHAPKNKQ
ncbi:MAG: glutathione peroxidase, partial [Clostridia bacterium]|nr:glutathione peroxidase [Clostridia bacterium]